MPRKLTNSEFLKRVFNTHGDNLTVNDRYINKKVKVETTCNICGHIWMANPESLWNGHGCPKCANNIKRTTEEFKEIVYNLTQDEYEVLGGYTSVNDKILMLHCICGNKFYTTPKNFMSGHRCPNERYTKSAYSNMISQGDRNNRIRTLNQICEEEGYTLNSEYNGSRKKISVTHKQCGTTFEPIAHSFICRGTRCPICKRSLGEECLNEILSDMNIDFKEQFKIKECRNIRPLPFDFAILKGERLIALIEYDGLQHFQKKFNVDDTNFNEQLKRDKIKDDYCKRNNIPLIRIKYKRCYYKSELKTYIRNELIKYMNIISMAMPSQVDRETVERCND